MRLDALAIPSAHGKLAALHYGAEAGSADTVVIYSHGFTSGKYSMDSLASYLASRGYPGITFDFVGHKLGASGGEMRYLMQAADNLQDVLDWVRQRLQPPRVVLAGHSLGGLATLAVAAAELETPAASGVSLAGIACLCVGVSPGHGFESAVGQIMLNQRSDYVVGAPAWQLVGQLDELAASAERIDDLPTLLVAASQDILVPESRVHSLAARIGNAATVAVIESSHLEAPERSRRTLLEWLDVLTTGPNAASDGASDRKDPSLTVR